ncbi:hypothetical protein VP1G_04841 [Cytospora mali]|uniref:Uncharacterized protein n=1 Tax=Cytospora mali TaxID=578113 RepID=A0A194V142_CYTMA|nr:hypothetical protein VP1G_04841 [Valsa mali var. pyri (nom. inval.)]
MSSVIAVCVSFIGLALILINAVIFIQMILSFPAMLSSNSQAYVQQQRKYHHIPSPEAFDSSYLATSTIEGAEAETETEQEQEWVADESVDRWIDEVDDQTNDCSSEVELTPRHRAPGLARGLEPITRGRPLRRQRRRHTSRAVFRFKDDHGCHEDDQDITRGRPHCVRGWRSVEWTK